MGRSERALWQLVREALKPYKADLERVENAIGYGTPDVNYCLTYKGRTNEGWLELKEIERWPVGDEKVVRVDHYTPQQRVWARKRSLRGGKVYMLLRVAHSGHIMLIEGARAAARLGLLANRPEVLTMGLTSVKGAFPTKEQLLELVRPHQLLEYGALKANPAYPTIVTPVPE